MAAVFIVFFLATIVGLAALLVELAGDLRGSGEPPRAPLWRRARAALQARRRASGD